MQNQHPLTLGLIVMSEVLPLKKTGKTLGSLADKLKEKAACKPSGKKASEWVLRLNATDSVLLHDFCQNQAVIAPFEANLKDIKPQLTEVCYAGFLKKWWADKRRPSNPLVQSLNDDGMVDCEVLFVFNDKFMVNIDGPSEEDPFTVEWAEEAAQKALVKAGLTAAKAKKFVEAEIDCLVTTHFLTVTEMMEGHIGSGRKKIMPTEQTHEAGRKLLLFLDWNGKDKIEPLTQDEISAITYNKVEWVPRPGLLDRIFNHTKSIDELKAILTVFQPVLNIRSHEFAASDSAAEKKDRLQKAAKQKLSV